MQENMFLIISENGLDVKTITKLVNVASEFESDIKFMVEGREADAKSIINLMALNIKQNQELTINITGDDAKEALEAVVNVLKEANSIK